MTKLRKRMIEEMQLRNFSKRTQESYIRSVRQLAEHYGKSPEVINDEELRQYFLYVKNVKKWARPTSTIALCGIKFVCEQVLKRDISQLDVIRARREKKLPVILTIQEVKAILGQVRLFRHRVCLATIYSCGLRLGEGTTLQVPDIDSTRVVLHIRGAKGAKDRYVPFPALSSSPDFHSHPLERYLRISSSSQTTPVFHSPLITPHRKSKTAHPWYAA